MEESVASTMNPKVVDTYRAVGRLLKSYRSGKVPKAFKVIPLLANWEDVSELFNVQILFLTTPSEWSPQAMLEGTQLFVYSLNAKMTQRFLNLVLLPAVRANVEKNKKLNVHLYEAVKKAIFKPNAFFKGLVLPLSQDASAKEAAIVGSILLKGSLPVLHASAALLKMCEYPYCIGTGYFIKVLVAKKFSFPQRVSAGG